MTASRRQGERIKLHANYCKKHFDLHGQVYRPRIFLEFVRFPEERMVATTRVGSIKKHFRSLPDPRVVGRTKHLLIDVVVIAVCC